MDTLTEDPTVVASEETPEAVEAKKKPGPKPKPKGPRYEHPTLGRIIHVVTDMETAAKFNTAVGVHCAAIVTDQGDGKHYFTAHVFSPTTNPDYPRLVIWDTDGEPAWHWPERD